jgi:TonB family protein
VPTPEPVVENPLPSRRLVAPAAPTTSAAEQRDGALQARHDTRSQGSGTAGGTGTGRGVGDGEGLGSGIGPGSGGGTGGGPYRAGSGVEPPRLLREVKAKYTDEARRRGTTGNVILEIVITREGTVGDVSVRRGLGGGLDERAVEAVRQWKFAPARRLGAPVDVIVEVAVEFNLR